MAKKKSDGMTFCGDDSAPFWQAVWGYYDMTKKKKPMPAEKRFEVLYRYGCRAQQIEEELLSRKRGTKVVRPDRVVVKLVTREA